MTKKILLITLILSLFCFTISYAQPQFDGAPPFEFNGEMPQGMPQGGRIQRPEGLPEGMTPHSRNQENTQQPVQEQPQTQQENVAPIQENTQQKAPQDANTENAEQPDTRQQSNGFGGMGGNRWGNFNNQPIPEETNLWVEYSTPIISIVLLGLSFIFVIFYKRKRY